MDPHDACGESGRIGTVLAIFGGYDNPSGLDSSPVGHAMPSRYFQEYEAPGDEIRVKALRFKREWRLCRIEYFETL